MLFFNRQWFLEVLYDQLKKKDCIQLKSRVEHIESIEGGVRVATNDGRSFEGDFVLGGDGVHSNVRQEMRRMANVTNAKYFEPGEEDTVPCYYQCSYGIAQNVDGWLGGEQCFTAGRGKSFLVVSGPGGRCYWFLFIKLPVVKYGAGIPKYSKEDEARFAKEHASLKIKENLTFGQVYAKRLTSTLTPLHEIVYKKWFFGRIFCVGDSAHKVNSRFNQDEVTKLLANTPLLIA
jgi:2-polyprenyl-6-methoxyphenol hydroxylase-like FAD-dependent oxidoreductase